MFPLPSEEAEDHHLQEEEVEEEDSYCSMLASKLSQNYRNTNNNVTTTTTNIATPSSSSSTSSLTDYLSSHGLLLTMCFPLGSCVLPFGVNHIASSWINIETGVRVIPIYPFTSPQIGLLLNSSRVKINCLYPTDGSSDGRDNNGCGPMINDAKYGSAFNPWWNRYFTKQTIISHKNLNFGSKTNWLDIDCNDFFVIPPKQKQRPYNNNPQFPNVHQIMWDFTTTTTSDDNDDDDETTATKNNTTTSSSSSSIYYKSDISWFADEFATIMGHPVCSTSSINNNNNNTSYNYNDHDHDNHDLSKTTTITTTATSSVSIHPDTTTTTTTGGGGGIIVSEGQPPP